MDHLLFWECSDDLAIVYFHDFRAVPLVDDMSSSIILEEK